MSEYQKETLARCFASMPYDKVWHALGAPHDVDTSLALGTWRLSDGSVLAVNLSTRRFTSHSCQGAFCAYVGTSGT
jgi:hypothetical protein